MRKVEAIDVFGWVMEVCAIHGDAEHNGALEANELASYLAERGQLSIKQSQQLIKQMVKHGYLAGIKDGNICTLFFTSKMENFVNDYLEAQNAVKHSQKQEQHDPQWGARLL